MFVKNSTCAPFATVARRTQTKVTVKSFTISFTRNQKVEQRKSSIVNEDKTYYFLLHLPKWLSQATSKLLSLKVPFSRHFILCLLGASGVFWPAMRLCIKGLTNSTNPERIIDDVVPLRKIILDHVGVYKNFSKPVLTFERALYPLRET